MGRIEQIKMMNRFVMYTCTSIVANYSAKQIMFKGPCGFCLTCDLSPRDFIACETLSLISLLYYVQYVSLKKIYKNIRYKD